MASDDIPTRVRPPRTPVQNGIPKFRDPVRGAKPDEFFSIGGQSTDVSKKIDAAAKQRS